MVDLQGFVNSLRSENKELKPLVENATEHAEKLAMMADRMLE